jgi:hypothetical protein
MLVALRRRFPATGGDHEKAQRRVYFSLVAYRRRFYNTLARYHRICLRRLATYIVSSQRTPDLYNNLTITCVALLHGQHLSAGRSEPSLGMHGTSQAAKTLSMVDWWPEQVRQPWRFSEQ